jgi:hypothetical protein
LLSGALLYINQVSPSAAMVLAVLAVVAVIVLITVAIRRWERPAREEMASEPYARLKFFGALAAIVGFSFWYFASH